MTFKHLVGAGNTLVSKIDPAPAFVEGQTLNEQITSVVSAFKDKFKVVQEFY